MLSRLWRQPLSASVIDCHYDAASDTISACDTNGLVLVIDSDTVLHSQAHVALPAWGVAHILDKSGEPFVAVAEARKASRGVRQEGGLSIIDGNDEVRLRVPSRAPCWDVALSDDAVWCSSWGGEVFRVPLGAEAPDDAETIAVGGQAYGLALGENESALFVCVADHGIIEIDLRTATVRGTPIPAGAAAYNLTWRGKTGVAGSTDAGVLVVDTPMGGNGVRPIALGGEVSAVAIVQDEFLVAGDLGGSLALFHISQLDRALDGMTLPDGIWNLSSDSATGRVYVACGDGYLYALELGLDAALPNERLEDLRDAVTSHPPTVEAVLGTKPSASEVALALAEIDAAWNDYSRRDIDAVHTALKHWAAEHTSARLSYRLGIAELEREHWDDAIVALQQIEQTSDSYVASLLPLAEAFDHIGSPRTAINVLKANLDRIPATKLLDVLFRIGQFSEKCGDTDGALTAYEAVSYQNHSYPGVRDALSRLRPIPVPALAEPGPTISYPDAIADGPSKGRRLGSRRRLAYDQISYIQYQYGPPADEAKKILEEHAMTGVVVRLFPQPGRSLDIGCATGRWPIWFSRRGWSATGYDIAPAAIEICELQAEKMPNEQRPSFRLHDICQGPLEVEGFDLVSTMMGTFNHLPHTQMPLFLRGIWDSLLPGGAFVFTSWNAQSRFCDFLNLDSERAKADLRRNCLETEGIATALEEAGFEDVSTNPIVFLPNQCYDVWEDDLDDPVESFIEFDDVVRGHIAANKAQMHFYVARKPR